MASEKRRRLRKYGIRKIQVIAALALVIGLMQGLAPVPMAQAATLTVDNTDTCDDLTGSPAYCTIAAAIAAAAPGDTVEVAGGTYYENVVIGKSLTLMAAADASPVIDGDTDSDTFPNGNVITIASDEVAVIGFEIRNGFNGITGETSMSAMIGNVIHDNFNIPGSAGVGILLWGENDEDAIQGNLIFHNDRQGVVIGFSDDSKISNDNFIGNNVIYGNGLDRVANGPGPAEFGIHLWHAEGGILDQNEIFGHDQTGFGHGVYLVSSIGNALTDNHIYDNTYGVSLDAGSADTYLAGNVLHDHEVNGLTIRDAGSASTQAIFNQFCRNGQYAVQNQGFPANPAGVNAIFNWWGSGSGPGPVGPGVGDNVSAGVDFLPWDMVPPTDGPCHLNAIHVQKYADLDQSGDRGENEPGLNGWVMTLYNDQGQVVSSGTTRTVGFEDGWALFEDLPPGDYVVCETPQNGWINSDPGSATPCKPFTVTDDGRGPGSGPLFLFIDHPGDDTFRFKTMGLNTWGLTEADLNEPDQQELMSRLSEPWLCLLTKVAPPDPELFYDPEVVGQGGSLDPTQLFQWDPSQGFEDGLIYLPIQHDLFAAGFVQIGVVMWQGSAGYSTATLFVECDTAPKVLFGNYQDEVSAITLTGFDATAEVGLVALTWETGTEIDNAGFNLYRATSPDGPWTRVNDALVAAAGDAVSGASYTYLDRPGAGTFYYQLEDVDYYGVSTRHGPVEATVAISLRRPLFRPRLPQF